MGGGRLFFHAKLNLIDPCHTVRASTVEGRQAGGLGHPFQYMRKYNAESPKQGRKMFNYIVKTVALLMKKTLLDHVRLAKGLITTPLRTDVRMQLGHFPMTNSPKESATG